MSWHLKALKPEAENVQYPTFTHLNSTGEEVVVEKIKQKLRDLKKEGMEEDSEY